MKLLRKPFAVSALMSAAAVVFLGGCGGGGDSGGDSKPTPTPLPPSRAALVGTWRYKAIKITNDNSSEKECPAGFFQTGNTYAAYCGGSDGITLNDDGTFTSTMTETNGATVTHPSGTWTLDGDELNLLQTVGNAGIRDTSTISISGDGKTFTSFAGTYTKIFAKQ